MVAAQTINMQTSGRGVRDKPFAAYVECIVLKRAVVRVHPEKVMSMPALDAMKIVRRPSLSTRAAPVRADMRLKTLGYHVNSDSYTDRNETHL